MFSVQFYLILNQVKQLSNTMGDKFKKWNEFTRYSVNPKQNKLFSKKLFILSLIVTARCIFIAKLCCPHTLQYINAHGKVYPVVYLKVSPSVVASIKYNKSFLHFYFHIDYTFNLVRNGCIQMEHLTFVWIFELQQIMQHNCSY